MKVTARAGEAVLIDGPSVISIVAGSGHVFFKEFKENEVIEIPIGVTYPFVADTDVTAMILSEEVSIKKVDARQAYPESWITALETISSDINNSDCDSASLMVIGGTSSGKSGFISSLANWLNKHRHHVYILDLDVGQNKLLVPGCMALSQLENPENTPVPRGNILKSKFLGSNSPRGLLSSIIGSCWQFKAEWDRLSRERRDDDKKNVLLIDTTGYVSGLEALSLKKAKIDIFNPRHVVLMPESMEATFFGELMKKMEHKPVTTHLLTIPPSLISQNPQDRKKTRESKYSRLLSEMTPLKIPMSEIPVFSYSMKLDDVSEVTQRLIGLLDKKGWLIGLGYLKTVDLKNGMLHVLVKSLHDDLKSLLEHASSVVFSYIRLNEDGTEIVPSFTDSPARMGQNDKDFRTQKSDRKARVEN